MGARSLGVLKLRKKIKAVQEQSRTVFFCKNFMLQALTNTSMQNLHASGNCLTHIANFAQLCRYC